MPELIQGHEWVQGPRTRVLIEATEWYHRERVASVLRAEGYDTVACPGPEGAGQRCRLAAGEGCVAAEQADVVVHALGPWDRRNVEALRALRSRLPDLPIVVEARGARRDRTELEGCVVVEAPASGPALLDAVSRALAGGGGKDPGSSDEADG